MHSCHYLALRRYVAPLRERLLTASLALVTERGLAAFSLRQVAGACGVSPGAVYRHFRDKEDLLTALAEQGLDLLLGWLAHYEALAQDADPLDRFRAVGLANLRFAFEHPVHFQLLNNPDYARADRSEAISAVVAQREAFVNALLEEGAQAGRLREPAHVRLAAESMTYGLCRMYVDGHLPGVQTHEQLMVLAEQSFYVLAAGLVPREGE